MNKIYQNYQPKEHISLAMRIICTVAIIVYQDIILESSITKFHKGSKRIKWRNHFHSVQQLIPHPPLSKRIKENSDYSPSHCQSANFMPSISTTLIKNSLDKLNVPFLNGTKFYTSGTPLLSNIPGKFPKG